MIRVAIVGLGKMGVSHMAIANAHPRVDLVAACDSTQYVLDVVGKYTKISCYSDYRRMLDEAKLDAVVVATPSRSHGRMVRMALERGVNVFCEKPFCLDVAEGEALASELAGRQLVGQVGYHYRFVGAFREAKRVIESGALGDIHHIRSEAYGPVVLRHKGATWRTSRVEGGGCLYDYACHAIDLMNYLVGPPAAVSGAVLNRVFSNDVEDEVYASLHYGSGMTGQLAANWSDESHRKMSTKVLVWGTKGRISADRQECQVYLRSRCDALADYDQGWTVRYVTDLTDPVWYYLRGEEYSAQIDHFVNCVETKNRSPVSSFESALQTDRVVGMIVADAAGQGGRAAPTSTTSHPPQRKRFFDGLLGRSS